MLEGMNFVTLEASSGPAAVDEIRKAAAEGRPYEMVYLDWRVLVMVAAYGREEMLRQARFVGIENVLIKPVTPSLRSTPRSRRWSGMSPDRAMCARRIVGRGPMANASWRRPCASTSRRWMSSADCTIWRDRWPN